MLFLVRLWEKFDIDHSLILRAVSGPTRWDVSQMEFQAEVCQLPELGNSDHGVSNAKGNSCLASKRLDPHWAALIFTVAVLRSRVQDTTIRCHTFAFSFQFLQCKLEPQMRSHKIGRWPGTTNNHTYNCHWPLYLPLRRTALQYKSPLDFYIAEPKWSKSRSDFQGNEGPSTLGRTFIDVSLSFDRLPFNLSGISGELFEHFESAVDSVIKYARLTAMTNLCRRHFTGARWEPLCWDVEFHAWAVSDVVTPKLVQLAWNERPT